MQSLELWYFQNCYFVCSFWIVGIWPREGEMAKFRICEKFPAFLQLIEISRLSIKINAMIAINWHKLLFNGNIFLEFTKPLSLETKMVRVKERNFCMCIFKIHLNLAPIWHKYYKNISIYQFLLKIHTRFNSISCFSNKMNAP